MSNTSKPLIYLASASPRRSALLHQIGVAHHVWPVEVDERVHVAEQPPGYVQRLAGTKARALWARLGDEARLPVLAADTAVVIDEDILGKPRDEADGLRMLRRLSGRTHAVYTAVAVCRRDRCDMALSVSEVTFRSLSNEEMLAYWRSGEPADKAGAYAVQGRAALYIERIAGSYSGIMGLPIFETGQLLQAAGLRFTDTWTPVQNRHAEPPAQGEHTEPPTQASRKRISTAAEVRG
jgi:septum formation protein